MGHPQGVLSRMPSCGIVFTSDCHKLIKSSRRNYTLLFICALVAGLSTLNNFHLSVDSNRLLIYLVVGELKIPYRCCWRVILYLFTSTLREGSDTVIVLDPRLVDIGCHLPPV